MILNDTLTEKQGRIDSFGKIMKDSRSIPEMYLDLVLPGSLWKKQSGRDFK